MIIFFDIDGTLLGLDGKVSDSTRTAIEKVRDNGHKVCIATGRARGGLPKPVAELDWDGYVLGNGTYGEYQGELVTCEYLDREPLDALLAYTRDIEGLGLLFDSHDGSYMTETGGRAAYQSLCRDAYFSRMTLPQFFGLFNVVDDIGTVEQISKVMYFGGGKYAEDMIEKFQEYFDFLPNSIVQARSYDDGEIMKKGISKATAINQVIARAGYQQSEVVAFGDGYNDIEMIRYAGTGVAMGNGVDDLKKAADLVTAHHCEDGIRKALEQLNLI